MCGRLDQNHTTEDYLIAMKWPGAGQRNKSEAPLRANVPPGLYRPLLHVVDDELIAEDLYWGYRPVWAAGKIPIAINARLDKLAGKYWGSLMKSGRCIVPADGWYEWTGEKGSKQPWHINYKSHEPLFMAALANFGTFKDHRAEAGFAIVTADAEGGMVDVHDRRPVVLSAEDAKEWLDQQMPPEEAEHLLRTAARPADEFEWFEVSKEINSTR